MTTNTINQEVSKLEQVREDRTLRLSDSADRRLTPAEKIELRELFETKNEFTDNEAFHKSNAQKKLFEDAPDVQKPDVSWYHPVVDSPTSVRNAKNNGSVVLTAAEEAVLFMQYNYTRFRLKAAARQDRRQEPSACVMLSKCSSGTA